MSILITANGFAWTWPLESKFELEPDETREFILLLGQTESVEQARLVINRYRQTNAVKKAFEEVCHYWDEMLSAVQIVRRIRPLTIMSRWLVYQTLSCRLWARTAFYQSSGAYGFRDQLQDVLALLYAKPEIAREHILRTASRQFRQGDVQHWWHQGLESILGFKLRGDKLTIEPCLPGTWPGYEMTYHRGKTEYEIKVENRGPQSRGVTTVEADGTVLALNEITLIDDGMQHEILIVVGEKSLAGENPISADFVGADAKS
jgi:cellobiose phosphorylase